MCTRCRTYKSCCLLAGTVQLKVQFKLLTAARVKRAILRYCAKFRDDRSSRCQDMPIYRFLCKMAPVRHLGSIWRIWRPHMVVQNVVGINTVGLQCSFGFNILRVWLENACSSPKTGVFIWPLSVIRLQYYRAAARRRVDQRVMSPVAYR